MSKNFVKPAAVIGGALLGTLSLTQLALASETFKARDLGNGYQVAALHDDKAKEGKCGEGKCGFDKIDTDGNGSITKTEWDAAKPDKADHFAKIDSNGDGTISKAELDAAMAAKKGMEGKCGEGKCGGSAKKG